MEISNNYSNEDWNPQKGDFIKENSSGDSDRLRRTKFKYNFIITSLAIMIIIVLVGSLFFFSQ